MTSKQIEEQIAAIREAIAKASVSKEAALAFLIRAGIVKPDSTINSVAYINEKNKAFKRSNIFN